MKKANYRRNENISIKCKNVHNGSVSCLWINMHTKFRIMVTSEGLEENGIRELCEGGFSPFCNDLFAFKTSEANMAKGRI